MRYMAVILASVFLAFVTAVGVNTVDPAPAVAANNYAPKCGGGKILLKPQEKRSFYLHNKTRINRDLPRLCVHPALQKAARAHSKDMIARDYFAHNTKGGGTFEQRLRKYGYRNYSLIAENIAWGSGSYGNPDYIFRQWMKSPSHRPNILNRKFREIGIGTYTGTYTYKGRDYRNTTMYTADFGVR